MGKLLSIRLIELLVNLFDFITLPLYYLIQQPWKLEQLANRMRARQVDSFTWANVDNKLDKSNKKSVDTLDQLFRESVATYAAKDCLGVRKILAVEYKDHPNTTNTTTTSINGNNNKLSQNGFNIADNNNSKTNNSKLSNDNQRTIVKYNLDNKYTWYSYKQIEDLVIQLSSGLISLCYNSLDNSDGSKKLLICADTCMQWFLIAHACFRNNVTVVTAYTTLDDEAILHSIQQTEVKILVVSQKFAHRLYKIIENSPLIDTIIILDDPLPGVEDEIYNLKKNLLNKTNIKTIISYKDLLIRGQNVDESIIDVPRANDIAVLMYTSGSTGKAKGVMLSHKSIVYTALSFSGPGDISHEDRYIGYLPLGHVLELAAECIFLRNGSTIAYSSPFTLTNYSPMIKKGQYGDAYIFRPTIMGAVPLVLDRIKNSVQQTIKSQGPFFDQLLNDFVVRYKRYWWDRYYSTPIMNLLICRKFNMILGGKIRAICSGGAALSRDTQEYLRHVTNYTVLQGYGLTETSAAASFSDIYDRRYNIVGAPYPIVHVKLESWADYSVQDQPYPRGEVIIGGQPVSSGYYKMDELTKESFFVDENTGIRYFRTGDIGLMLPDGVLKIIDRKKQIVKPLSGEYISLSEIEMALSTAPIIENICVYCSQYSNYIVALVRPDQKELKAQAIQLFYDKTNEGETFKRSLEKLYSLDIKSKEVVSRFFNKIDNETLCNNSFLVERILKLLQREGAQKKLKRTQIPSKIKLVSDEWSPESGLVTASFKLRRREIERHYANDIKQLYAELGQNIDQD